MAKTKADLIDQIMTLAQNDSDVALAALQEALLLLPDANQKKVLQYLESEEEVMITFTAEDIKKAKFVDLVKDWDDGEPLWEGLLQLTMMDGSKKEYRCDWIRQGHRDDVTTLDKEAIIDYIIGYEPEEIM